MYFLAQCLRFVSDFFDKISQNAVNCNKTYNAVMLGCTKPMVTNRLN